MAEKRVIEQTASTEIYTDDWFLKDSPSNNTKKIQGSVLKELMQSGLKEMLTQAEYNALPSTKLSDNVIYYITDTSKIIINGVVYGSGGSGASALIDLEDVNISNPTSGQVLTYDETNDEWINANSSGGGGTLTAVELTKAQYDALTSEQKNDPTKIYFVTDYNPGGSGDRVNSTAAINTGGGNALMSSLYATGTDIVHS